MFLHCKPNRIKPSGFTFGDVLMAFAVFTIVIAGLIYGYVQVNRISIFSSMNLAAQSFASQGLEEAKSVQWNFVRYPNNVPSADDPFWTPPAVGGTSLPPQVDTLDIPTLGTPFYVTNFVTVSNVFTWMNYSDNSNSPLREIRCTCVWALPATFGSTTNGPIMYTNYAISLRAPDQ